MLPLQKSNLSIEIYDSKQKQKELHTSERTIVPRTVIFIVDVTSGTSPDQLIYFFIVIVTRRE